MFKRQQASGTQIRHPTLLLPKLIQQTSLQIVAVSGTLLADAALIVLTFNKNLLDTLVSQVIAYAGSSVVPVTNVQVSGKNLTISVDSNAVSTLQLVQVKSYNGLFYSGLVAVDGISLE